MTTLRHLAPAISERARYRLYGLGVLLLILGFALARGFYLPESDLFWGIRAGQTFLQHGTIPRVEQWAWLIEGRPWLPNSWAWNVLLAFAFNLGGTYALGTLNLLLYVGAFLLVWRLLRLLGVGRPLLFILLTLTLFNSLYWLTLRPQEADYLLLLTFLVITARWRNAMTPRRTLLLVLAAYLVTTVWMNLHLTGTAAVGLLPAAYLILVPGTIRPRLLVAAGITLAAALGTLSTPFGLNGITKGGTVFAASRGLVFEWTQITFALPAGILAFVAIVIFGLLPTIFLALRHRWLTALTILTLATLAFEIPRFVPYLVFFALLSAPALPARLNRSPMVAVYNYIALGGIALILGATLALPKLLYPDSMFVLNRHDLDTIPVSTTGRTHVLTLANGGALTLLYRHDLSPSLDSRNDIYGLPLYTQIVDLFYYDDQATVTSFLTREHVGAVYAEVIPSQHQPPLTIVPILRRLHWQETRTADAYIFLPPTHR